MTECIFTQSGNHSVTCARCGLTIRTPHPPERCHAVCKAGNDTSSEAGNLAAEDAVVRERRAICRYCEHSRQDATRCDLIDLGCSRTFLELITSRGSQCPLGRWPWFDGSRLIQQPIAFTRTADLIAASYDLARQLPLSITGVVGVPRSGMISAGVIAAHLHLPLGTIDNGQLRCVGEGTRSSNLDQLGRHVLIVDDTIHNGGTLGALRHALRTTRTITWAAVFCRPSNEHRVDLFARHLPAPHVLEWNVMNTFWTQNIAADMDGVICDDCTPELDDDGPKYRDWMRTVKPRHLSRFKPLCGIITARLEKYRNETTKWLDRWGVRYRELIMCPAANLAERATMDLAAWKAGHADRLRAEVFLESSRGLADAMDQHCKVATPLWVPPP